MYGFTLVRIIAQKLNVSGSLKTEDDVRAPFSGARTHLDYAYRRNVLAGARVPDFNLRVRVSFQAKH